MSSSMDQDLVGALRSSEPATFERAFRAAYAAHRRVVYGLVLRLCGDAHTAADLFQNVWLKLSRHRERLRPDTDLRAWLCTVARREYLSYRRAQTLDPGRLLAWGREPSDEGTGAEPRLHELNAALQRLSDGDREVLLLTSIDGLSPLQAAAALEVSEPALRQRLARARRRLASILDEEPRRHGWLGALSLAARKVRR